MRLAVPLCLALALSPLTADAKTAAKSTPFAAALADPARPEADRARDATRHPAELLAFAGVKPGQKVADFIMGGGYWTRILSNAVGPKGKVYAYQPAEFITYRAAYADEQKAAAAGRVNVVPLTNSLGAVSFAEPLDTIITVQNWHDLHLKAMPAGLSGQIAAKLFAALKPGGTLLVIDHVGTNATPFAVADTLHRGDAAATRAELEAAGFRYDGASTVLAATGDPHTASVFAPEIRGKTDQFVYRFKKGR